MLGQANPPRRLKLRVEGIDPSGYEILLTPCRLEKLRLEKYRRPYRVTRGVLGVFGLVRTPWDFYPSPPVAVCGTVAAASPNEAFLVGLGSAGFR